MIRTTLAVLLLASTAVAGESWYTAMTPLDPRPPLPSPSEPDRDTDNSGPFHSPAPAVVKASAKAKPKATQKPAPKAEPKTSASCSCEPCECGTKVAPQAKALDPAFDPRLKRMPSGFWYGTTVSGQTYYSAEPADVLRMLDSANAYYTAPAATPAAYCTTGTCPR